MQRPSEQTRLSLVGGANSSRFGTIFEEAAAPRRPGAAYHTAVAAEQTELMSRSAFVRRPPSTRRRLASWLQCRGAGATIRGADPRFTASDLKGAGFTLNALWDGAFSSALAATGGILAAGGQGGQGRGAAVRDARAHGRRVEEGRTRAYKEARGAYSKRRQRGGKTRRREGRWRRGCFASSWMTSSWTTAAGGSSSSRRIRRL